MSVLNLIDLYKECFKTKLEEGINYWKQNPDVGLDEVMNHLESSIFDFILPTQEAVKILSKLQQIQNGGLRSSTKECEFNKLEFFLPFSNRNHGHPSKESTPTLGSNLQELENDILLNENDHYQFTETNDNSNLSTLNSFSGIEISNGESKMQLINEKDNRCIGVRSRKKQERCKLKRVGASLYCVHHAHKSSTESKLSQDTDFQEIENIALVNENELDQSFETGEISSSSKTSTSSNNTPSSEKLKIKSNNMSQCHHIKSAKGQERCKIRIGKSLLYCRYHIGLHPSGEYLELNVFNLQVIQNENINKLNGSRRLIKNEDDHNIPKINGVIETSMN